jgi:3-oxoacyl-[acyl-carrier protein] reductase
MGRSQGAAPAPRHLPPWPVAVLADDALVDERVRPTVVVTGGASGVGKATSELLSRSGFLVAVADRDEVGARAVADACGGFAVAVDAASESSIVAMFGRALDVLGGRLDAVAIAGSGSEGALAAPDDEVAAFVRLQAAVVLGTHLCIREAAKRMGRGGRICVVAGTAGDPRGSPAGAALAASNAGVEALTRVAAHTLAARGIAVNGVVHGPLVPRGSDQSPGAFGTPDGVAETIAWLLSPRAAQVSGAIITVDGGLGIDVLRASDDRAPR